MKRLGLLLVLLLSSSVLLRAQGGCVLKQSTAGQEMKIGPFLSSTDGDTEQTTLTINSTDIWIKKGSADPVNKNSGGLTHESKGNYRVVWDATDTSTAGIFDYWIHLSGSLYVWGTCFVEAANYYDARVASDILQVDVAQVLGVAPNALIAGRFDSNIGAVATNGIDAVGLSAAAVTKIQTGLRVIPKNAVFNNYYFKLRNADGTAYTAGTSANIACTRSLDGSVLAACAGTTTASISHVGQGTYKMNIAASDTNADSEYLRLAGPNCASTAMNCWEEYIKPQR